MKELPFEKSLASSDKAKYWSEKNGDVTPQQVSKSSCKKYFFDCPACPHTIEIRASCVTRGNFCIYCAGKRLCSTEDCNHCYARSFASHEKAKYWSPKNGDVTPRQVAKSTHTKYHFDCPDCSHTFDIGLNKVGVGRWCRFCFHKSLCADSECESCFEKSFASHERSVFWSNVNTFSPRELFKSSHVKGTFDCHDCGHQFKSALSHVTGSDTWCLYCTAQALCTDDSCDFCFNHSFASSERASQWSELNEKTARQVFKSSGKRWLFNCSDCGHQFDIQLNYAKQGHWCPFCSNRRLCSDDGCETCYNKSFASHEKAAFWSEKNGAVTPRQLFNSAYKTKYVFDCKTCNHSFESKLCSVSSGKWCPCCSGTKLCNKVDCTQCFNRSFASSPKAMFWSNRNELSPRQVTKSSNLKFWFNCGDCDNQFEAILGNVKRGHWCAMCKNKTEHKLHKFLKTIYPSVVSQFRAEWCKNVLFLPLDFCITELKIIIELDGQQHFFQVMNWKSPEETRKRDKFKEKLANENEYSTIRILQLDVCHDRYDWRTELVEMITEVAKCSDVVNRYMCKNNEYEKHASCSEDTEPTVTTITSC